MPSGIHSTIMLFAAKKGKKAKFSLNKLFSFCSSLLLLFYAVLSFHRQLQSLVQWDKSQFVSLQLSRPASPCRRRRPPSACLGLQQRGPNASSFSAFFFPILLTPSLSSAQCILHKKRRVRDREKECSKHVCGFCMLLHEKTLGKRGRGSGNGQSEEGPRR